MVPSFRKTTATAFSDTSEVALLVDPRVEGGVSGKAFASDFIPESQRASGVGWYSTSVGLLGPVASIGAGLL
jgi:hypothetical protein